eukprot:s649_g37.t4
MLASFLRSTVLLGLCATFKADSTACEIAFFNLVSEDACGNENGPDASSACSATCKPLACSVVSSCTDGSSIAYADEKGPASISADEVRSIVKELESEHTNCPCSATKRSNLTKAFQTMRKSAKKDPVSLRGNGAERTQEPAATACETAFFNLVSEDACGNENGPDASSACSATCKPLALVSSCTDGSSIAYADEKGPASISAEEVKERWFPGEVIHRSPTKDMMMLREDVVKEVDYLASRMQKPPAWPRPVEDSTRPGRSEIDAETYRVPVPGDRVSLRPMRRHPELTGAPAQVMSGVDPEGFVTVRLKEGEKTTLKVHIERLRPLDPPSERKEAGPRCPKSHQTTPVVDTRSHFFQAAASVASASATASRLGSTRSASVNSQKLPSRPSSRPSSAARSRPSRPSSAKPEASCDEKKTRLSPDEIQQQLIRQKLGPYQAAAAYAAVAAKSAIRSRSEPSQVPVSFLTSPQKRMEDAWQHLPAGSEEERQALYEGLSTPQTTKTLGDASHGVRLRNAGMVYETFKDRRPKEPRVEELQREAKRAKSELDRALQVPVPEDEELDSLPDVCPEEIDQDAFEAIQGLWRSSKGECAIFTDQRTNRLTYEESLSDQDARLHGWLEPEDEQAGEGVLACWVAVLHLLDEDEMPWYGPSFGEEPEALGQIKVELLPGMKMQTSIRIEDEDEDWQSPTFFSRRTEEEIQAAAAAAQLAAAGGAFVFGAQ